MKLLSRARLFGTPMDSSLHQAPLSMGFSKQEYWSGLPFPSPGDLPDSGIEPRSPALQADTLLFEPPGKPSPLNLKPLHGKHHCHGKDMDEGKCYVHSEVTGVQTTVAMIRCPWYL